MAAAIPEHLFGLTPDEIMAYAAIANLALAGVLVVITAFYAWHAKRQADANREQVAASKRQADAAQKTLDLLLKDREEQRQIDNSAVDFQLEAAIQMMDDWRERIHAESYDLPDVIEILPATFGSTIARADRIDSIVAGYMGAAVLYVAKAEADVRVMREQIPGDYPYSPLKMGFTTQTRNRLQERAGKSLNIARFKLDEARTRLRALTEGKITLARDESGSATNA